MFDNILSKLNKNLKQKMIFFLAFFALICCKLSTAESKSFLSVSKVQQQKAAIFQAAEKSFHFQN